MSTMVDGTAASADDVGILDEEMQSPDGESVEGTESPEADNDVVVTIGEQAPLPEEVAHAPEWVRGLRKNYRELQREKRELEEKLKAVTGAEIKPAVLGQKPTLEGHDYDAEKYENALSDWYDQKRCVDEQTAKTKAEAAAAEQAWQTKLATYGKSKADLKVRDFDDAEAVVQESFSAMQQGIILQGAENPALVIYALGKNAEKAKKLAAITDPVKYAFAVAKLETQLKVTNRREPPPPEAPVRGTGSTSGAVDSSLERLRAEAEKTGDYSKVVAYKRSKKAS